VVRALDLGARTADIAGPGEPALGSAEMTARIVAALSRVGRAEPAGAGQEPR
jgi:hypothetical protein